VLSLMMLVSLDHASAMVFKILNTA
jgi:hypothetical protein